MDPRLHLLEDVLLFLRSAADPRETCVCVIATSSDNRQPCVSVYLTYDFQSLLNIGGVILDEAERVDLKVLHSKSLDQLYGAPDRGWPHNVTSKKRPCLYKLWLVLT